MRVALGAGDCRAHPNGHGGVDAIDDRRHTVLFVAGSAFVLGHRIAMEGGRNQLTVGRVGQQVTRDLLDRETIEWQIAINRIDHPITIAPNLTRLVAGVPGTVRIASEI